MNSEPCVRLGIRISPKIRENPAERRNSSPPKVMLLTASTSQKVIAAAFPRSSCQKQRGRLRAPAQRLASGFHRREIAGVNRLLEELLLVVSPELTHIVVSLDRLVDELAVRLFEVADEKVANNVSKMVKLDRATRRIRERYRFHRGHQCGLVVRLAAGLLQSGFDDHAVHVESCAVEARIDAVILVHCGDKPLV